MHSLFFCLLGVKTIKDVSERKVARQARLIHVLATESYLELLSIFFLAQKHRLFRVANFSPFAGNLVFVLYNCPRGDGEFYYLLNLCCHTTLS